MDDRIQLTDLLMPLWRRRWLIIGITLLGMGLGALVSYLATPMYKTSSSVLVRRPRLEGGRMWVSSRILEELLMSQTLYARALASTGLGDGDDGLTVPALAGMVDVESATDTGAQSFVDLQSDIKLLRIWVRNPDPEVARELADAVASEAVSWTREIREAEAEEARSVLVAELKHAEAEVGRLREELLEFKTRSGVRDLESRLSGLMSTQRSQEQHLVEVETALVEIRARLASLESQMEGRERLLQLERSVVDDPAFGQVAEGRSDALQLRTEILDPVFQAAESQWVSESTRLEGLLAKRENLRETIASQQERLQELESRKSQLDLEGARLERDLSLAEASRSQVHGLSERSNLNVYSRTETVVLVDRAFAPEFPYSPDTRLNLLLGAALAAIGSCGLAFVLEGTSRPPALTTAHPLRRPGADDPAA